jgi:hypothetical protein
MNDVRRMSRVFSKISPTLLDQLLRSMFSATTISASVRKGWEEEEVGAKGGEEVSSMIGKGSGPRFR